MTHSVDVVPYTQARAGRYIVFAHHALVGINQLNYLVRLALKHDILVQQLAFEIGQSFCFHIRFNELVEIITWSKWCRGIPCGA